MGNLVVMRFTISGTDAQTDSLLFVGRDQDVAYDYGSSSNYEPINHSDLPFIIDTTDVDLHGLSFTYDSDGGYYQVTMSKSGFAYKVPGFKITKWALSQGDITVYFYNIDNGGAGTLDGDELAPNDTLIITPSGTIVVQDSAWDSSTGSNIVTVLNPEWAHRTAVEDVLGATPYELTDAFADVGSEISVDTYKTLTLWITLDVGTSTDVQMRLLFKHTSAGSEEYREIYLGNPGSNITTINANDYRFEPDADGLYKITVDIEGVKYVQVQFKDASDGDGQIDDLYATKTF